ncbi:flippase [Patescibacteria group bacterium]|nr:flippase [Patescibacteria group bacterium]MBU1074603.1 flippase [Patescibacteria group bacterium]MBU1952392.1 flippase [Patescibacteria group bacterium]
MEKSSNGKIARNTTFLTGAFIFQKVLSFFYFAYISRQLGSESIGKYVWALSFAGIFALFIEFGLGPVLTREISRDYSKAREYLSSVLGIKIVFSLITVTALLISAYAIGRDALTMQIICIAVAIIVLDSFTFSFYSIFRAYQKLHFEAIGLTIYQALIVGSGVAGIVYGLSVKGVVLAVLIGSVFNFAYSLSLVVFKAKLRPRIRWNTKVVKLLLKIAIPFAIAGIFFKLNNEIDKVLLGILAGDKYVGWYSIASKFNMSLTFIPGAFATSFFPAMSRYYLTSKSELAHTFEKAMIYLMAVSLPIAAGSFVLADRIILKLYGPAFEASILAFQIIISGLVFVFLNYPVGNFLNACNKQKLNTINMGIATAVNIILNVVLIPRYTYIGASIAAVTSAVVLVSLGMPWVSKIAPYSKKLLLSKFIKLVFSSGSMGILLYLFRDTFSVLLLMPIGMVIYFVLIFAVRAVTIKDVTAVFRAVFRKQNA